jgi:hypothetical protein
MPGQAISPISCSSLRMTSESDFATVDEILGKTEGMRSKSGFLNRVELRQIHFNSGQLTTLCYIGIVPRTGQSQPTGMC